MYDPCDSCGYCDSSSETVAPMDVYLSSAQNAEEFELMLDAFTRAMFGTGGNWRLNKDDGGAGRQGDGATGA